MGAENYCHNPTNCLYVFLLSLYHPAKRPMLCKGCIISIIDYSYKLPLHEIFSKTPIPQYADDPGVG